MPIFGNNQPPLPMNTYAEALVHLLVVDCGLKETYADVQSLIASQLSDKYFSVFISALQTMASEFHQLCHVVKESGIIEATNQSLGQGIDTLEQEEKETLYTVSEFLKQSEVIFHGDEKTQGYIQKSRDRYTEFKKLFEAYIRNLMHDKTPQTFDLKSVQLWTQGSLIGVLDNIAATQETCVTRLTDLNGGSMLDPDPDASGKLDQVIGGIQSADTNTNNARASAGG
jgi:hypothetical protein